MVRVDPVLYQRAGLSKPDYLSKAAFINTLIEKGLSQYGEELRKSGYTRPHSRQDSPYVPAK